MRNIFKLIKAGHNEATELEHYVTKSELPLKSEVFKVKFVHAFGAVRVWRNNSTILEIQAKTYGSFMKQVYEHTRNSGINRFEISTNNGKVPWNDYAAAVRMLNSCDPESIVVTELRV